jgi:hypothetical protein
MLDEYIVGGLAGLEKTIHAFADFNENESVDGDSHIPYWPMGVLKSLRSIIMILHWE